MTKTKMQKIDSEKTSEESQRAKRKEEWKKRKRQVEAGENEEDLIASERAQKALYLLRIDFNSGKDYLESEEVRQNLKAIVIQKCINDFYFFAKFVLENDLMVVEPHRRWCDDLQKAVLQNEKRVMRLKPRKTFKTTIYGIAFILWVWGCISQEVRFFYTSSSKKLIDEVADSISSYVGSPKNETFYSFLFNIVKDPDAKNTTDVINIQGRKGKGFSLTLATSGGSTTGLHPNVIMIDDACGEEDLKYQRERDLKEIWFDTLQPLLVPFFDPKTGIEFESIFYIGTHWHLKDLIHYIETEVIKKRGQRWDVESESITTDRTPNGPPSYPDFYPRKKIDEDIKSMSVEFFSAQMLNNPIAAGMLTFDLNRLHFIKPEAFELIRPYGKIICSFDPALGTKSGDWPAVIWLHQWNDTITMFRAINEKLELSILLPTIAQVNKELGCRVLIFEKNNALLLEQGLQKAHDRAGHKIILEAIHHGSGANKEERIKSMQPELYSGAVQFMSDYETRYGEAMNQIAFYGVYDHDDFCDSLEQGISYLKEEQFKFIRYEGMS